VEINLIIIKYAAIEKNYIKLYKILRLVSKSTNRIATQLLVEEYISNFDIKLNNEKEKLQKLWVSDADDFKFQPIFTSLLNFTDELGLIKKAVHEKKQLRALIFQEYSLNRINLTFFNSAVSVCNLQSEMLAIRSLIWGLQGTDRSKRTNDKSGIINDPLLVQPPKRRGPPGYYPGQYPGEPDPDHMTVPDWEKDKNPPFPHPFPGYNPDPFGPGHKPYGPLNPRNPYGPGSGFPRFL